MDARHGLVADAGDLRNDRSRSDRSAPASRRRILAANAAPAATDDRRTLRGAAGIACRCHFSRSGAQEDCGLEDIGRRAMVPLLGRFAERYFTRRYAILPSEYICGNR